MSIFITSYSSCDRFGRSYPQEPTAADIREAFQRTARRGNAFLRFGRTQPIALTADDLVNLIKSYDEDNETKRSPSFIRYGRDPSFIRFGRTPEVNNEHGTALVVSGYPQRKNRARDHFIRLGRDNEELDDVDEDERRKRSTEPCHDCQ